MTYLSDVLAKSPSFHYRHGEASGTTVVDSSGNSRNSTYVGSYTLAVAGLLTGDSDTAVTMTSARIQIPSASWMDTDNVTVNVWIKATGGSWIIGRDNTGATSDLAWRLDFNAGVARAICILDGSSTYQIVNGATSIAGGTRYMLTLRYNGSQLKLFVNGVADGTPVSASGVLKKTGQPINIGASGASGSAYSGVLDETTVFPTALSDAEILALYNSGITAPATNVTLDGELSAPAWTLTGDYDLDAIIAPADLALDGELTAPSWTLTGAYQFVPIAPIDVTLDGELTAPSWTLTGDYDLDPQIIADLSLAGTLAAPDWDLTGSYALDAVVLDTSFVLDGHLAAPTWTMTGSYALVRPPQTETANTVAGRTRGGHGVARWEPPVVAPPGIMASGSHVVVEASAFGPVTMRGSQPIFTVSTAAIPRARQRILMGGKDISFWRDTIPPDVEVQLAEPLLYGPASVTLPQVAACFEKPGVGALRFMRKHVPVVVQLVINDVVIYELYRGFVLAYDNTGRDLVVQLGGEAQGRAALVDKQEPLFRDNLDLGRLAWRSIRDLGLPFEPRLGPETGIPVGTFGGMGHLDYIADLCAKGWTRAGNQWTIMPDDQGVYRMRRKDTTTVDFTLFADDARTVAALRRDTSEEPTRVFVRGVTPSGQRVRFGVYPGMKQSKPAPYPFDDGRDFGVGTTNEDTDTGDGISRMIGRLRMLGHLSMEDVPGGYDQDVRRAVEALQEASLEGGLASPGDMDEATWRVMYDLDATRYTINDAHIEPAAQRRSVRRYRRSASGAIMGLNPDYKAHAIPVDATLEINGFKRQQMREFAETKLVANEDEGNWVGTITLRTGAVLVGDVAVGATVTPEMLLDARRIKPGMNARLPLFNGTGILVHVADVTIRDGEVSLLVDTQARDAVAAWEVMNAHRETRNDPARKWRGNRASTQVKDAVDVWDEIGGLLDGDVDLVPGWNVIRVVAGQEGTVSRLRAIVQTINSEGESVSIQGREFALAVFGRPVSAKRLRHLIGNPLAASPEGSGEPDDEDKDAPTPDPETSGTTDPSTSTPVVGPWWEKRGVAAKLRRRDMLLALGTREEPCGYSPGRKSNGGTRTGLEITDSGFSYRTGPQPVLYLAVWVWGARTLSGGRVMWNQLEAGA